MATTTIYNLSVSFGANGMTGLTGKIEIVDWTGDDLTPQLEGEVRQAVEDFGNALGLILNDPLYSPLSASRDVINMDQTQLIPPPE